MPPLNGSIHGMSLLVGELKGAVDALTQAVNLRHAEAADQRREQLQSFDRLRNEVFHFKLDIKEVKDNVADVQQDVAEMKEAQATVKITLESYNNKEQRALGWWDATKKFLTFGKVVGGLLCTGAFVIIVQFVLPRLL